MKPGRLDFCARRGKPFYARFKFQQEDGEPIDMTGWSGKLQVRRKPGAPVIAEMSTIDSTMVLNREPGLVELLMDAAYTAARPIINARHDVELRDSLNTPIAPVEGRFEFEGVITE